MPKPLRRIGASKLATVSQYNSSYDQPPQVPPLAFSDTAPPTLVPLANDRPANGIVLTIADGPRAGELIGTDEHEVMLGFHHDCLLRFSSEQYPQAASKLLLRRGTEGWYVVRVSGDSAFVNQHQLKDKFPLRSGDILRLSSRGPDIQFTMQSGGSAIRELVDRYLPSHSSTSSSAASDDTAASAASGGTASDGGPSDDSPSGGSLQSALHDADEGPPQVPSQRAPKEQQAWDAIGETQHQPRAALADPALSQAAAQLAAAQVESARLEADLLETSPDHPNQPQGVSPGWGTLANRLSRNKLLLNSAVALIAAILALAVVYLLFN